MGSRAARISHYRLTIPGGDGGRLAIAAGSCGYPRLLIGCREIPDALRAVPGGPIVMATLRISLILILGACAALSPSLCETPPENRPNAPEKPPTFRPEGFQFEVQMSSMGTSYDPDLVRASITGHHLGEFVSVVAPVIAAEWGYSFTHLDGQLDGAGRKIEAGYSTPPADRAECLRVIEAFLHRQYIRGADHPWASMNGHYPWHHYAAEFGFDQIGSEIGENINNYQWHLALNRGAARQYHLPWFIDFSAWHGPSITDYSEGRIWGENSGADYGHSMSLFERSLFVSYMAGAGQITAEAGGAIAFLTDVDENGYYRLSPYGEVCKRFYDFTQAHPDIGTPYTPFALVLDYYHGAYPGFEDRKAFGFFPYTPGDDMTWNLVDLIWPGGWEVMGKKEKGTLVSTPYGDVFDVLLQNAPQDVLNSYPCLILSGDIHLSAEELTRYHAYVAQGGTLVMNSVYLTQFPNSGFGEVVDSVEERGVGMGRMIAYGPDYDVRALEGILRAELARLVPFTVSPGVEYLVNVAEDCIYLTLVNNDGVTKAPREQAAMDTQRSTRIVVKSRDGENLGRAEAILNRERFSEGTQLSYTLEAGEVGILRIDISP